MITIYGIPACNTMKKAFDYLVDKDVKYAFHNYKKEGISAVTLQNFIDKLGIDKVLNKQGSTYRQLSDKEKDTLTEKSTVFLFLLEKNSAIKRPIITNGNRIIAGFDPKQLDKWLNN